MPTLTMQSIADLTQVRREVVSVWRSRSTGSDHPFPPPLSAEDLLFDTGEVAAWLEATGRGNNPEAPVEVLLHSSQFEQLREDLDATSTLLLVHDLVGGPLSTLTAGEVLAGTAAYELGALVAREHLAELLERTALVRAIDELAEAAFSGRGLLDRLITSFAQSDGPWAGEALTPAGTSVLLEVLRGLLDQAPFRLDPQGRGGLLLATALSALLSDERQPAFGLDDPEVQEPVTRAAMRMLAAHAGPDAVGPASDGAPHLALCQHQDVPDPHAFFTQVESVLLDLGPQDAAVVIGPCELLVDGITDEQVRAARHRLLLPTPQSPAPLRYAARLPKGLSRFGGRRRLALWVFGTAVPHAGTDWTVYGEHADTSLDASSRAAIAADVTAALTGGTALTAHAFLRSTRLATPALLRRRDLVLTPFSRPERSGGESLARLWELDDGMLGQTLSLLATGEDGADPTVAWADALDGFAREIRGTRLPPDAIGAPAAGSVAVIGPQEVRDPQRLGDRAIDRLVLEKVAARSTFTAPGDVVFTAEGGVAAFVDTAGGHVLQAPVRALRCLPEPRRDRVLHPQALAADIAGQEGRDRRTWRLRTVPAEAVPALDAAALRLQERRAELRRQLSTLDHLEDELIQAVAAGTLAATITTPTKEN
ncbi:hypothetical protein [Brachybacterium vulturis]|uniref:hypothetical protein n=1 Tax=Brachybacterium vulturis TaxID=2017484 RepID=UPI003736A03C